MKLNQWIIGKVALFLTQREGMTVVDSKSSPDAQQITIEDAFGFRYTVEVKMVARVKTDVEVQNGIR